MARYSLIAKNKVTNQEFKILLKNKYSDKAKEKVDLFEIDLLTSAYKDKNSLLNALKSNNCIDFNFGDIYIAYNYNGEEKRMYPIYDDSLIKRCALENYNKLLDSKGHMRNDISGFNSFVSDILKMTSDTNLFEFIINNNKIDKYFVELLVNYKHLSSKVSLTLEEIEDLKQIKFSIKNRLLHYRIFRTIKVCLIDYEFMKRKSNKNITSQNIQYKVDNENPYGKELYEIDNINNEKEEFLTDDEREEMLGLEENYQYYKKK